MGRRKLEALKMLLGFLSNFGLKIEFAGVVFDIMYG